METDIESIERATVAAVAPSAVEELDGWLLPFDSGVVGRAKSAVPLRHHGLDERVVAAIEARYAARAMPTVLRIPDVAGIEAFRAALHERGYRAGKPTRVQVAPAQSVAKAGDGSRAEVATYPDDEWAGVFLGEGFDPVDGASRVQTLRRAAGSLFASVRDEDGKAVAAGVLAMGHGWASIHGMRTAKAHRGRGLATRILATLASIAQERGFERMVLQVEQDNADAQSLYAKCGFTTAWAYGYWEKR